MLQTIITGNLACDNSYVDATCKDCGGRYNSMETQYCKKCGKPLTYLQTTEGILMGISEGTVYPDISKEDQANILSLTEKGKGGAMPIFRFTLRSYADDKKSQKLIPPDIHRYLAKGRRVLITTKHQPVYRIFDSKKYPGIPLGVEARFSLHLNRGDTIEFHDKKKEIGEEKKVEVSPDQNAQVFVKAASVDTATEAKTEKVVISEEITSRAITAIDLAGLKKLLPSIDWDNPVAVANAMKNILSTTSSETPSEISEEVDDSVQDTSTTEVSLDFDGEQQEEKVESVNVAGTVTV